VVDEATFSLLAAVVIQWAKDAQRDHDERAALAWFLGIPENTVTELATKQRQQGRGKTWQKTNNPT